MDVDEWVWVRWVNDSGNSGERDDGCQATSAAPVLGVFIVFEVGDGVAFVPLRFCRVVGGVKLAREGTFECGEEGKEGREVWNIEVS